MMLQLRKESTNSVRNCKNLVRQKASLGGNTNLKTMREASQQVLTQMLHSVLDTATVPRGSLITS